MSQSTAEREQNIDMAWKGKLLEKVRQKIQKQMVPNFSQNKNEDKNEFHAFMWEYMKGLRGTDPFDLWTIIWFPQVMRDGIAGVVFSFTVQWGKKYIFKTALYDKTPKWLEVAQLALQERSKQWVKVPTLVKKGNLLFQDKDVPFEISEFVFEEDRVKEKWEELFQEMGHTIAKMHRVKGEKFLSFQKIGNKIVWESDEYKPFPRKMNYIKEFVFPRELMNEQTFKNLNSWAYETLLGAFKAGEQPTLIHKDIWLDNIIFSRPITIIDPNPILWHPYEDLWGYFVKTLTDKKNSAETKEMIINNVLKGYEKENWKAIDHDLLDAAIIVRGMWKMYTRLMRVNEKTRTEWVESVAKLLMNIADKHGLRAS